VIINLCHRCSSRQIFGGAKDFCRISPNLPKKFLGHILCEIFLMRLFVGWPPKKALHVTSGARLGAIFFKLKHGGCHICPDLYNFFPDFQRFCRDFYQIKIFGGALTPCTPASYTTDLFCTCAPGTSCLEAYKHQNKNMIRHLTRTAARKSSVRGLYV